MSDDPRYTVDQAAEYVGLARRGKPLGRGTWTGYVSRGQAPQHDGRDERTGRKYWRESTLRHHIDHPAGQGTRTDKRSPTVTDIDIDVPLPAGIHVAALTAHDPYHTPLRRVIVWADRPYDRCPRCGESLSEVVSKCPAHLDGGAMQGGALESWAAEHGCGEWVEADWTEVTTNDVTGVAAAMAARRAEQIAERYYVIEDQLRRQLREALADLAQGEDPEDVATGSEDRPGVYLGDGGWTAWGYAPVGADIVSVDESSSLTAGRGSGATPIA